MCGHLLVLGVPIGRVDFVGVDISVSALSMAWSRFVSGLVHNTELQVRCRDFENDVLVAFDQRHPSVLVSVRPTDSLEFHIDLEVRTVSADERTLQSR